MSGRHDKDRDRTPGYPEETPDSKHDAQNPHPKRPKNPDEGGMERDPDADAATDEAG